MTLTVIAAVGAGGEIGAGGDLAFHIRADLRRFKELTMGHPVIMGRRTFESLPKGALPGRRNIVVTRSADFSAPEVEVAHCLDDALAMAADADEAFIIGGAEIYRQVMEGDRADCLQITRINASRDDADTYFPNIDPARWTIADPGTPAVDEATGHTYCFMTYTRS